MLINNYKLFDQFFKVFSKYNCIASFPINHVYRLWLYEPADGLRAILSNQLIVCMEGPRKEVWRQGTEKNVFGNNGIIILE